MSKVGKITVLSKVRVADGSLQRSLQMVTWCSQDKREEQATTVLCNLHSQRDSMDNQRLKTGKGHDYFLS